MIFRIFLALALLMGAAMAGAQPTGAEPAPADTTEQPEGSAETEPATSGDQPSDRQRAPSPSKYASSRTSRCADDRP